MEKKVLITGINGQDGILLSRQLLKKDFKVFGLSYQNSPSPHLDQRVRYLSCDIRKVGKILDFCDSNNIEWVFNLASISSVARSFQEPELTREINFLAPSQLLCGFISRGDDKRRFFQASSSEMFGNSSIEPQDESTPLNPVSPYAHSKSEMFAECLTQRELGHFVASAIMYNHESYLRPSYFLTKKIAIAVAELYLNKRKSITLGNLEAERDWGYAGDHIAAAWMMLDTAQPETFVIATGKSHTVLDIVTFALESVGLGEFLPNFIEVDPTLFRPQEVRKLVGNPTKAQNLLGWQAKTSLSQLIADMVRYEIDYSISKSNS